MYGGVLTMNYQQNENGLLVTLPGRYRYEVLDDQTVALEVINFSGCEDSDFTFYLALHLEHPFSTEHTQEQGEDGTLLLSFTNQQQVVRFGTSFISQKQACNYQHIFDAETAFMRAKDKQGVFRENFLDIRWGKDYAEGSAWQSSFAVYQDFAGLIQQFGSKEVFEEKLVRLCNQAPAFNMEGYGFEIHEMSEMAAVEFGQLAISNQPSFHYPFLFSYIGKPEMAQPLIKQLLTQTFNTSPSGYPGDEDNGSMAG